MSEYYRTVTARKRHRCESGRYDPECPRSIKPGEEYVRCVAFPGSDANNSERPWVMDVCRGCFTRYGRPMPERKTRARKEVSPC